MKTRLSFAYFSMFAFIGVHMPFWPVWLKSKGLAASEIAILTALAFSLKIIFTPIVSRIVDATGRRNDAIISLSLGLFVSCLLFFQVSGFVQIFLLTLLAFACWSPIMSLVESLTTVTARERKLDYGKIRLWGSVAFMLIATCSGRLLQRWGEPVLLWSISSAAGLLLLASFLLPRVELAARTDQAVSFQPFLRSKWFVFFILATTLIQGSHAGYYTFSTIHWRSLGLSDHVIGLLWGGSMAVEVCFFALGRRLVSRLGAVNVIVLGGAAAALRWAAIGATGNLGVLLLAQSLHALSFGASHFAAMKIITDKVEDSFSATAQGVYFAFTMGVGMGAFVLLSGPLFSQFHGLLFFFMSAVSLVGVILAFALRRLQMPKIMGQAVAQPNGLPAVGDGAAV